ncbi:uncharacterized protein LY79DRAFT_562187, partial [Colletotrichum navitas]
MPTFRLRDVACVPAGSHPGVDKPHGLWPPSVCLEFWYPPAFRPNLDLLGPDYALSKIPRSHVSDHDSPYETPQYRCFILAVASEARRRHYPGLQCSRFRHHRLGTHSLEIRSLCLLHRGSGSVRIESFRGYCVVYLILNTPTRFHEPKPPTPPPSR